uniref:Peroxiredoxin like 2B n=1 Tax=Cyprinus carpio carpio TaxID=630221 RepID=A0A8C1BL91_CYPCA
MSSVNLTSLGANQVKNTTSGEQTIQCYMVEIGSLWREQTVVLFFLQRFGCQVYFEKHMIFFSFLFKWPELRTSVSQCKNVSLCSGGEKVLLHFAGEKPQVKQEEFVRSSLFDTGI